MLAWIPKSAVKPLAAAFVALTAEIGLAPGDEPASKPFDPTSLPSLYETRLAVQARKALLEDAALAPLISNSQIGVRVRQNVATLIGTIPSQDLADRAVKILRSQPELQILVDVRNELEIVPPGLDTRDFQKKLAQAAKDAGIAKRLPAQLEAPRSTATPPNRDTPKKGAMPYVDLKGPEGLRIMDIPAAPASPTSDAVKLLAPVTTASGQPASGSERNSAPRPSPHHTLQDQINVIQSKDDRFTGIHIRVEGSVVYLSPTTAEDLFDLAEIVARIPGVTRVTLER